MAGMTIDDLRQQLSGLDEYVPEDEATLRQRAIDIYSPQYQQDLSRLRDQIEFQVGRQQRSAINTGMQRSSYNAAQQAAIRTGGIESEAQLAGTYETNIAQTLLNLLEKEKDRKLAADQNRNNLLLQLYDLEHSGRGGGSTQPTEDQKRSTQFLLDKLMQGLGGGGNQLFNSGTNNTLNNVPYLGGRRTAGGTSGMNLGAGTKERTFANLK